MILQNAGPRRRSRGQPAYSHPSPALILAAEDEMVLSSIECAIPGVLDLKPSCLQTVCFTSDYHSRLPDLHGVLCVL